MQGEGGEEDGDTRQRALIAADGREGVTRQRARVVVPPSQRVGFDRELLPHVRQVPEL